MWLEFGRGQRPNVPALKLRVVTLEMELFESQQFERIASAKLETWVKKHDDLLIRHKALEASLPNDGNTTKEESQVSKAAD